ncbi:hypothetical protein MAR_007230 [Mya arenaria]|uniref:DUF7869 domain-containing protein n=1 Tax=Mya arenaria TaxID=6604 RepID=A0ABY7DEB6_MYAAR|nr:hypothetical protein MAR_007230 [Mya arenaria]
MENKNLASDAKEIAKSIAESNPCEGAACFDLQQVMMLPKACQSGIYFSRKLNNYDLSIYSLGTGHAYCYVWNKTIGGRGSCEIASCVFSFLNTMASDNIKSITTFSDNCGGQNRNPIFLTILWYSVKALGFSKICHKYLERGLTQNENDSVHSTIERSCKNIPVYTTSQWVTCMRMARRSNPYHVTELTSEDFIDFKELSTKVRNLDTDSEGSKIKFLEIKTISFSSDCPDTAVIQYDYGCSLINLNVKPRLRNNDNTLPALEPHFRQADFPKLSKSKNDDLMTLCEKNTIPQAYHSFYKSLPVAL